MSRYVILEHDHPRRHWDFMLESGDVLRTWRLEREPLAGVEVSAEPSFDHRMAYLDYEGPVSGGRGSVAQWDAGTYELIEELAGRVVVELSGRRLRGRAVLWRAAEDGWRFTAAPPNRRPRPDRTDGHTG